MLAPIFKIGPRMTQVLSSLHSSGLSDAHLALLRPLHQRGAQKTRKQQEQEASLRKQVCHLCLRVDGKNTDRLSPC